MKNSARALRPLLVRALREGFTERGWELPARGAEQFTIAGPTTRTAARWSPAIEADRYGGLRFGGSGAITSPDASGILATLPKAALSRTAASIEDEAQLRAYFFIDARTAGGLLNPAKRSLKSWLAGTDENLPGVVGEFFAMVDGPLKSWVEELLPVENLLAQMKADPAAYSGFGVEPAVVLALLENEPELARELLVRALDRSLGAQGDFAEVRERLVHFERELAARYPAYGPPHAA